ncbi:hypothetical protein [Pontiella agarivorans]|uniref:Zinc-finger domain-containing protein n=1 Tax=Pontiella agarivorans TaxID=3038953 RepID=A0ABU5MVU1_9BACT|nr:hypothetical protein [Pontiella agarivorans]MDZ8118356.1 hypothetical protein [Pontiella agarivorans]
MTARYQELLSLYLDGDPAENELHELAELLKSDRELAGKFRQELLIWETWSQEHAPERSATAFLAGLHTRLRAENDASAFESSVTSQLKEHKSRIRWKPLLAIAAVAVILLSLGYFISPSDIDTGLVSTAEAAHVHIQGKCVCMHCTLKREGRCRQAVRFKDDNGEEQIIPLQQDPHLRKYSKHFCKLASQVDIEGSIIQENGERVLVATAIRIDDEKIM